MLWIVFSVLFAYAFSELTYPRDAATIDVVCPTTAKNFFQCGAIWTTPEVGASFAENVRDLITYVEARAEVASFITQDPLLFQTYQGMELYSEALDFYGVTAEQLPLPDFLLLSYFLDYHASNVFTVTMREEKEPVVGFSGSLFAVENDGYDEIFMDALRSITIQYRISIGDRPEEPVPSDLIYAIGYFGSFSLPYYFSPVKNNYADRFAVAYNADYNWSIGDNGNFFNYTELFHEGGTRTIPPGVFMVNFIAPGSDEINTVDPRGERNADRYPTPLTMAPMDFDRFRFSFALRYGLRNEADGDFVTNTLAYSADEIDRNSRYTTIKEGSWNYCRSLGRNNKEDTVFPEEEGTEYTDVPQIGGEFYCNTSNLPSVFFMTHTLDSTRPFLFSTKYQLMTDGSCQYRTALGSKSMPVTSETNTKFGYRYGITTNPDGQKVYDDGPDEEIENLPAKTTFILNRSDLFGIHVVDVTDDSTYVDQTNAEDANRVPPQYRGYLMNDNTIDNLRYDGLSMCNTAIDDNYVQYDIKEYAYVYGSLGAITNSSFGVNAVYTSMRTYPTKTNYTTVVSSAQVQAVPKTQIQKCINVYLDTQGKVIAACNDVTSTWDWAVFGGSFAGILVVVGLWVWGGLYSKSFKNKYPAYYQDLVNYEAEWKRKDAEAKELKAKQKAAKKAAKNGMTVPPEPEESSNSTTF